MTDTSGERVRIVACSVFRPAIDNLRLEERYPNLRVTYLPAGLHNSPHELRERLVAEIDVARARNERVLCLYGNCFPDIEAVCQERGAVKVPGHYCYEMLLGSERFKKLVEEATGTYFVEEDLIRNFKTYCMEPLELDDEEMRKACFERYHRLIYVRQPSDPNLVARASEIAEFLGLSLEVRDADYSQLERALKALL